MNSNSVTNPVFGSITSVLIIVCLFLEWNRQLDCLGVLLFVQEIGSYPLYKEVCSPALCIEKPTKSIKSNINIIVQSIATIVHDSWSRLRVNLNPCSRVCFLPMHSPMRVEELVLFIGDPNIGCISFDFSKCSSL